MLILRGKLGERVVVAGNVFMTVVEIQGHRVKLAFHAPHEVSVHPEEIYLHLQRERPLPIREPETI